MVFHVLADAEQWKKKRDSALLSARSCRESLINPPMRPSHTYVLAGKTYTFPAYQTRPPMDRDDPRVTAAVGLWVRRARHAHGIAMGRLPVIPNFIIATDDASHQSSLFAQ